MYIIKFENFNESKKLNTLEIEASKSLALKDLNALIIKTKDDKPKLNNVFLGQVRYFEYMVSPILIKSFKNRLNIDRMKKLIVSTSPKEVFETIINDLKNSLKENKIFCGPAIGSYFVDEVLCKSVIEYLNDVDFDTRYIPEFEIDTDAIDKIYNKVINEPNGLEFFGKLKKISTKIYYKVNNLMNDNSMDNMITMGF